MERVREREGRKVLFSIVRYKLILHILMMLVDDLVTQATDAYVTKLTSHIADTPTTHSNRAVCVLIYLTKGLLIRSHPSQTMLIDKVNIPCVHCTSGSIP